LASTQVQGKAALATNAFSLTANVSAVDNLVTLEITWQGAAGLSIASITDNQGNTWTIEPSTKAYVPALTQYIQIAWCNAKSAGTLSGTVTLSSGTCKGISCDEWNNVAGKLIFDAGIFATGNGPTLNSGSLTTSSNNELGISQCVADGSLGPGFTNPTGGFSSLRSSTPYWYYEELLNLDLGTAGSESAGSTLISGASKNWGCNFAAFKVAAGVSPADITDAGNIPPVESVSSPAVAGGISGSGAISVEALGSIALSAAVASTGIPSTEAVGQPAIGIAAQEVFPSSIARDEAFGNGELSATVGAEGVATAEAIGQPAVGGVAAQEITTAGIASAEALGQPSASAAIQTTGITSAEFVGQPNVGAAAAEITAGSIASGETLSSPAVAGGIDLAGIASSETIGRAALDIRISAAGIASAAAVGAPIVGEIVPAEITGAGAIASAEAFGQSSVYPRVPYTGTGFQPGSGHRRPVRNRMSRRIELNAMPHGIGDGGIASGERFGYPALKWGGRSRKVRDEEFLLLHAA